MDKDRVKGAMNDAAGRVKRQVGEWTGDTKAQVEGTAQQIKGKTQKAVGTVKDAARDANKEADRESERQREADRATNERIEREHAHAAGRH